MAKYLEAARQMGNQLPFASNRIPPFKSGSPQLVAAIGGWGIEPLVHHAPNPPMRRKLMAKQHPAHPKPKANKHRTRLDLLIGFHWISRRAPSCPDLKKQGCQVNQDLYPWRSFRHLRNLDAQANRKFNLTAEHESELLVGKLVWNYPTV